MPAAVVTPDPARDPAASSPQQHQRGAARHTYTHLTYSRHHLRGIAVSTLGIVEDGAYVNSKGDTVRIKEDLDAAVENSVHYEHEFDFEAALEKHDADTERGGSLGSLDEAGGGCKASSEQRAPEQALDRSLSGSARSLSGSGRRPPPRTGSGRRGALAGGPDPAVGGSRRFPRTSFLVVSASWLEAASELLGASSGGERVGVLNSASGTCPGGRFLKGTVSQEDCLCRASLLYACISQPRFQSDARFYGKNRSLRHGSSNCVIFSPDVPVIREDNVEGKLLDSYEKVSFVTIPAPNAFTTCNKGKEHKDPLEYHKSIRLSAGNGLSTCSSALSLASLDDDDHDERFEAKRRALLASLSDRIHRALSAFVLGGCADLVLPAFGCGVHGNDPSMVAGTFREMLTDPARFGGRFRTVVFAVPPSRKQNYQAFAAYFQKEGVGAGDR